MRKINTKGLSRAFHKVGFKFKKHSPEILLGTGIIGGVTATVLACKATLKASEIVKDAKKEVENVHKVLEDPKLQTMYVEKYGEEFTPEECKKETRIVYAQTGLKLAKAYALPVGIGVLSLTSILTSHNIIRKRNLALAAAYTTLDSSFKGYRSRVIERLGKEMDHELRYDIKSKEVEEKVVDENGNETVVKKTVDVPNPNIPSDYARCFDETCLNWERDSEYNLTFLKQVQNFMNNKLQTQGYLFLNDVYEAIGIPKTRAGQEVGWIYDEKNPVGDNYVDFGIYDITDAKKREFVNGYEKSIWLDFNVDGPILHMMP
jgi:hypothetical protein